MASNIESLEDARGTTGYAGLTVLSEKSYENWLRQHASLEDKAHIRASGFSGNAGQMQPVYRNSKLHHFIAVVRDAVTPRSFEALADKLPAGKYAINETSADIDQDALALGWALSNYQFDRYLSRKATPKILTMPPQADPDRVRRMARAIYNTRDLINTPTNDMGPQQLVNYAVGLSMAFNAKADITSVRDDRDFPLLWHVGKAAAEHPRMIDIRWGTPGEGKINLTLIGKGVVYDTGGLALKPRDGMLTMKKDMGGAAHALGLAELIMAEKLPVNLRVLIPVVENAINERALRNGDIVTSRAGKSVEIINTDAEGRLILADALTYAGQDSVKPDLIIDFATLTAAARTVGEPGTPVIICNDKALARELEDIAEAVDDRLQAVHLDSRNAGKVAGAQADLANSGTGLPSHIFAAHFLNAFSPKGVTRIHVDQGAWGPDGARDEGLRATYALVRKKALNLP